MPIEILYTIVPVFMVGVLFYYTARDESALLDVSAKPDVTINVVASSGAGTSTTSRPTSTSPASRPSSTGKPGAAADQLPTLYLPVNKRVEFVLNARDVIHSFWVPAFLQKLDMIPGKVNRFQVVPTQTGTFQGKCAELCGAYHSQMLFQVKVVSQARRTTQHIARLQAAGQTGLLDQRPQPRADADRRTRSSSLRRRQLDRSSHDDDRRPSRRSSTHRRADHRRPQAPAQGQTVVKWITTTDHKVIGNLYFITSFICFMLGGIMALLIRAELAAPGLQVVDNPEQYNQLFTMHGTIMLLLFATPLFAGFANALMPLQIGAPDVAFPRLNMFAYWLYLFGGLDRRRGLPHPAGRGGVRLVRLRAAVRQQLQPGARWRPVGLRPRAGRASARSSVRSTSSPRSSACARPA